jgi:hypothetical protein
MSRSKKMKAVSSEVGKISFGTTILSTIKEGKPSLEEKRKFCSKQTNYFKLDKIIDRSEIIKMFSYDDNNLTIVITDKYVYINPYLTENLNASSNRSIASLYVYLIPFNTILTDGQIVFVESSNCISAIYDENVYEDDATEMFQKVCCVFDPPIIYMNVDSTSNVVGKYTSNVGGYNGSNYDIYVMIRPIEDPDVSWTRTACYIRAPV